MSKIKKLNERRHLAIDAFNSVNKKANQYPAWMQEYFTSHFDAYNAAAERFTLK
jgi:hypothetical protein